MLKPLRAIMVDLDGTLARTALANWKAYSLALREAGANITKEDFEARVQGRHWSEFLPQILSAAASTHDPAAVATRKRELYSKTMAEVDVNMAIVAILTTARPQMKTALVTSAARSSVMHLLETHHLHSLFDTIVTGDDVKHHKPHPEAYQLAAAQLSVQPDECVIFEDSDLGVASAEAFGGHVLRVVF